MKLSVIIVNYNVEYFLEQCLHSVFSALKKTDGEVWVVDNNSIDGSCRMVKEKFPSVHLVENKFNAGFSKANNQAIKLAKGEYILLLNPDTVVEEDTFEKVVKFMDEHPDAGGLGVKMIDGKGNFLPESKRGLPTPSVAFYKIFGISALFPKSKRFGKYHLGYLDKDKTHEIEILSGAFMLMRKPALDKTGLLDEAFFMYGEDIDLSWRIIKAGYKNYYFPETRIIHYKGESTKKSSVNYVFVFYNAMVIFAKKHFSEKNAKTFSFLINLAIWLRASVAILNRFFKRIFIPATDFLLVLGGLYFISLQYQELKELIFPSEVLKIALPAYTLTWILSVWLSGGYDKPVKLFRIIRGLLAGTALILMVYGLLPKEYQFSRVFILLGASWSIVIFMLSRLLLHLSGWKEYHLGKSKNKRFLICGKADEADRVATLLKQTHHMDAEVVYLNPEPIGKTERFAGDITQVNEVVDILKINEIIFCARDNSAQQIIDIMSKTENKKIDFKIAQPESLYLIGSNSIDTSGDIYMLDINSITNQRNKRNKRIADITVSVMLLVLLPLLVFLRSYRKLFSGLPVVLAGKKTLVGYSLDNPSAYRLPRIKKGLINTSSTTGQTLAPEEIMKKLDIIYAKDYRMATDIRIILAFLTAKKRF